MAVYKVPQDVEADDKLLGPFSFKQFVFIILLVISLYITYLLWRVSFVFAVLPLPFVVLFGVLGLWPRRKQPIEVYLLALIHFWTKPRKRIWSQEGHVEHVRINAPKKEVHHYSDGLSNQDVRSSLKQLANTMDSRGWSAKNVMSNATTPYNNHMQQLQPVIAQSQAPYVEQEVETDMLDPANSPIAQNFDQLTQQSIERNRQAAIERMQQATHHPKKTSHRKHHNTHQSTMTEQPSAAILNLARNSDLSVSTLAKQAEQSMPSDTTIELH